MGCCEATNPNLLGIVADPSPAGGAGERVRPAPGAEWDRRATLKSLAAAAGVIAISGCDTAPEDGAVRLRLAFCGQLLCVVPYEVARARGHFAAAGLAVELVYTRGGNAAMQALVGGAVDYAGTSFDVALQAAANGAAIRRVASTGRLPLFALATAPGAAGAIGAPAALAGRTVGISALGNADHVLLLFLLERAGVDTSTSAVRFAAIGTNVFDALRLGQVDAAMLQEPALSLIVEAGGRELANFMEIEEARRHLGGAYEFMGVSVRAGERDRRRPEIRRLAAALAGGLDDTRTVPPAEVVAALPDALVAGGDVGRLERVIDRYRRSLYPERVALDVEAAARVMHAQEVAGLLRPGQVDLDRLLDPGVLDG